MSKQELNGPNISAAFEQMNCEGMAQRVRGDRFAKARGTLCFFVGVFDGAAGNRLAWVAAWKEPILGMRRLPIAAQNLQQPFPHR